MQTFAFMAIICNSCSTFCCVGLLLLLLFLFVGWALVTYLFFFGLLNNMVHVLNENLLACHLLLSYSLHHPPHNIIYSDSSRVFFNL